MKVDDLKLLLDVAANGGFAPTARARDVDPSQVSRRVADVEARLGARLFERSTRRLAPTEAGAAYLARVEEALATLEEAEDEARGNRAQPRGALTFCCSVAFHQICVAPLISAFLDAYPEIDLTILATDAVVDLRAEGVDVALRHGADISGALIRAKLRSARYRVCASPAYLDRAPPLEEPDDLRAHDCVRFALPGYRGRWRFRRADATTPDAATSETPIAGRLIVSTALGVRQAALDGLGPALLADWLVDADIAAGRLIDTLPDYEATATEFDTALWLVYPSRRHLPAKTRALVDFLKARLSRPGATIRDPR